MAGVSPYVILLMVIDFVAGGSSVEVPIGENAVNLNWSQIMKTINDGPYDFFKEGGWAFLTGGNGSEAVCR